MVTVVQSFLSSAKNQGTDFLSMQQLRSGTYEVSQSIKRKINYFLSKHQAPTQEGRQDVAPIKAKGQNTNTVVNRNTNRNIVKG